jgi:hypothetical protein
LALARSLSSPILQLYLPSRFDVYWAACGFEMRIYLTCLFIHLAPPLTIILTTACRPNTLWRVNFQVEFTGVVIGEELGITAQISQSHRSSQMQQRIVVGLIGSD